ncbi:hypothetical protein AAG906_040129 [Vitis piasezkii]
MVGASSSWSRALVQISPSTFSVIGIAMGIGVSVLGAACLGTTLRALGYYFSGLEVNLNSTSPKPRVFLGDPWTIPVCGSLHSSSGPPMVSWDFSLGTTFKALRYYLRKSINHVSEVELGRATWTFLHTLAAQVCLNLMGVAQHASWFCFLNKPIFPCKRVDARWGKLKCELRACYLQGTPDFGEG